jgi:hypothetical protein
MTNTILKVFFEGWQTHIYQHYTVSCDICQNTQTDIILIGGGGRECFSCHMRKCKNCKVNIVGTSAE